jgi:hypothetical protein
LHESPKSYSLGSSLDSLGPLLGLLNNRKLNTLAARKSNPGLGALSNGEHIPHTGSKLGSCGVCHMDDVKASLMLLTMLDDTDTPSVTTTSDHDNVANVELDEFNNLPSLDINLDCVIRLDEGVWVSTDTTSTLGTQTQYFTSIPCRRYATRDLKAKKQSIGTEMILKHNYLIVRPSKVVMWGTPLSPNWAVLTLHNLY